jgi:hypothetical protein
MKPKHHELPQLYLKGFCQPGTSFVWVFEKGKPFAPGLKASKNNPYRGGIRVTALRKDGYAARGADGKVHFDYERKLHEKETLANSVLRKVRSHEPITADEKEMLARYIGLMMKRLTHRDEQSRPRMADILANSKMHGVARELAYAGQFGKARELMDAMAKLQTHHGTTGLLRESMLMDFDKVHGAIVGMPWRFLIAAPERYFVTTDNPVVFDTYQGLRNSPLLFPIGCSVLLDASRFNTRDLEYEPATRDQTRHMNAMMISQAHRHVYAPQADRWVQDGLTNGFQFAVGVDAEENVSPGGARP